MAIPDCRVHNSLINRAVERLKKHINVLGIQPYDEATHTGQLRYLQLTIVDCEVDVENDGCNYSTRAVQAVVVWNRNSSLPLDPALQQLTKAISADPDSTLCTLWVNYQPLPTNVIMGPVSTLLWVRLTSVLFSPLISILRHHVQHHGKDTAVTGDSNLVYARHQAPQGERDVWRTFGGARVFLGPASFVQANMQAMDAALAAMQRWVQPKSTVVDLHAGVGTIGTMPSGSS